MANKNLCIFILVATIAAQATWVRAAEYTVGDDKGWTPGVDYQAWLKGKEFYFNDALEFNFKANVHNVVALPDQFSFDNCCVDKPTMTVEPCGWNQVFVGMGKNYFTSSMGDDCKNGMKLLVDGKDPNAP